MILIKIIQDTLNKTQQDIANDLGVSRQTISMWHSGYKLSKKNIENISSIYNIPIELIQKTQISGLALSKEDVNLIKSYLLKNIDNVVVNNNNIVRYLFKLMTQELIFKSDNFNLFISKISDKNLINFKTNIYISDITINSGNLYLVVVHRKNKDLLTLVDEYKEYLINQNVCLLMYNDFIDSVDILAFKEEI